MDIAQIEDRLRHAVAWAEVASDIILEHLARGITAKAKKGNENDPITQADLDVDAYFHEQIGMTFPGDEILSEESAPASLEGYAEKPAVWVIDPLDGTNNCALGSSEYYVSVALVCHGRTEIAVVAKPATKFRCAATRRGFYDDDYGFSTVPQKVSSTSQPQHATIGYSWSYDTEKKWITHRLLAKLIPGDFRLLRSAGSAVGLLTDIARGQLHGAVSTGHPWDVAAGGLLVELAGGMITHQDGSPWSPFRADYVASNRVLHPLLLKLIHET